MSNSDPQGSLSGGNGAGEALDNIDFGKHYFDQPEGSLLDGHGAGEAPDNGNDIFNYLSQAGAMQFVPNPGLMNIQPPHQGAINNVNPAISTQMNSFPLAAPGTSLSSNITNADAERAARTRESKKRSREKKKRERRETEELLAEATRRNSYLTEVNARLEKEGVEAKKEQDNSKKIISDLEEEVSRLTNELQGQTVHLDELSKKLVATDVADENNLFKRKNELPTSSTNNPDIIKTDELQKENEMLKRKIKKLRLVNDALCDKLSKDEQ